MELDPFPAKRLNRLQLSQSSLKQSLEWRDLPYQLKGGQKMVKGLKEDISMELKLFKEIEHLISIEWTQFNSSKGTP